MKNFEKSSPAKGWKAATGFLVHWRIFSANETTAKDTVENSGRLGRKIASCFLVTLGVSLLLGNCSAWRSSAAESHTLGRTALRSGEYDKAKEYFEDALKSAPAQEESQIGLLEVLRETGAYREAEGRAETFLVKHADSSGLHLERGRLAMELGDYAEAESHLRRAAELGGTSHRVALMELADLLASLGRKREAAGHWDRLIDDYRQRRASGSRDLGAIAVAAWRLGYVQDAKDIFLDATADGESEEVSLRALSDFGYLFLEKYNATEAMEVFKDCLKINKSYPPALLGMAQAKEYEGGGEVYARTALEVNPNFVPALDLEAELRIQEEDYDAARREIRQALEVNPKSLESLSLEAVLCALRGDQTGFASAEERILTINPSYGRLYYTLAENLVTRRKYREAVEQDRKAVALDPELWQAHASLGMNLMRIGDLAGGRRAIETAFKGDPFNVWAYNTLELLDEMDKFDRQTGDHFVYVMSAEDSPVVGPYARKLAEEVWAKLTTRYGFTPVGPISLELFPDHGGFAVRTLGLPGLGALGVCFGKVIAMDSPRARQVGTFNWGSTLWHEFAHVITLQMTNHNIPRWYSEGLSVFEEHKARPGWGDDLSAGFVKAYKEGRLLKVSELNAGMLRPKTPEQVGLSYYQAALVCHLIEDRFGFDKIKQTLRLFAQNKSTEEVFQEALGWDSARLDEEYARYVDARVHMLASNLNFRASEVQGGHETVQGRPDKETLAAALKKNPDDFFANVQMGALLHEDGADEDAETYLKRAEQVFPEFTEPGNPYQILSKIYMDQKRNNDALDQLLTWTKFDENAFAPLISAAKIYRERKEWTSAARVLEQSIYINPYDQAVHAMLGEAALEGGDVMSAVAAYQVLVGMNPTDRAGAHYDLARAWLAAGKNKEAKSETLRALEIAPAFQQAQELLLKLAGGSP